MFRGRVGYDAVGNRSLREHEKQKRRTIHLSRISKIKHRKSGTGTLDNNLPRSMSSLSVIAANPRKKQVREEEYRKIERQNKILLQRIVKVSTGPKTYGETSSYQMMFSTIRNPNAEIEKERIIRCNKALFDNIAKTKPYYCAKEWENDYKRLLKWHKFMRQVVYEPKPEDEHLLDEQEDADTPSLVPSREALQNMITNSGNDHDDSFLTESSSSRLRKSSKKHAHHSVSLNPANALDTASSSHSPNSSSHISKLRRIKVSREIETAQNDTEFPEGHGFEEADERKSASVHVKSYRQFKSRAVEWDDDSRLLSKESRFVKVTVWESVKCVDKIMQYLDGIGREYGVDNDDCSDYEAGLLRSPNEEVRMIQFYAFADLACIRIDLDNLMVCVDIVEGPFGLHCDVVWDKHKVHRVLPDLSAQAEAQEAPVDNRNDSSGDSFSSPMAQDTQAKQNVGLREICRVSLRLAEVFITPRDSHQDDGRPSTGHTLKHSRLEIVNPASRNTEKTEEIVKNSEDCSFDVNSCILLGDIDALTFSLSRESHSAQARTEDPFHNSCDSISKVYLKKVPVSYSFSKEDEADVAEFKEAAVQSPSRSRSRSWSSSSMPLKNGASSRSSMVGNFMGVAVKSVHKECEEWVAAQPKYVYCAIRCKSIGASNMSIEVTSLSQDNMLTMTCLHETVSLPTVSALDKDSHFCFFGNVASSVKVKVFNRSKFSLEW